MILNYNLLNFRMNMRKTIYPYCYFNRSLYFFIAHENMHTQIKKTRFFNRFTDNQIRYDPRFFLLFLLVLNVSLYVKLSYVCV